MIRFNNKSQRKGVFENMVIISLIFHLSLLGGVLSSCARMGSPDGGWYDDTPPRVISSSPAEHGVNVKNRKVVINFDEYIKVEDIQNKVIVSPPQLEQADIKASGRRIVVDLKDSLKANTTYTIDFSDAITDNNEGNPMGNYTFSFSTGTQIDTLEVSGYVLNAENLEPMKGVLVGLYQNFADSVIHREPMMRVSRTNGSGRFTVKGVGPGAYRIYALQDADGDFLYGQKSEYMAFSHDSIVPRCMQDVRQDTIWRDSLHIANIVRVGYTHFLPDDVTLLCFQEPQTDRFLLKTERKEPDRLGFYFTYGSDSLPVLRGLNCNLDSAVIPEYSMKNDTITYWLSDTTLVNQDTLLVEFSYLMTDTLGQLVQRTDTLEQIAKTPHAKRLKEQQKAFEKWQKEQEKRKKREEPYDTIMKPKALEVKINANQNISPLHVLRFEMPEPLARCDTGSVHLYSKIDTTWYRAPHDFRQIATRIYEMNVDWRPDTEYSLEIDSAAFEGIYGQVSKPIKQGIKVLNEDAFSTLTVEISGAEQGDSVVVQLMDTSDKVKRQSVAHGGQPAEFYYLQPGSYYLRAFIDKNGNGRWDTGRYDDDLQPEPVFYNPEIVECKAKWDVSRQWNLTALPRYKQKAPAITKQKPDKEKQLRNRNLDRAKKMGKEYTDNINR
ncbi:Ig-like domain-containing protein [Prevotella sp. E13-17]|uniref:Ig-like domain-containing protein n=1 Tax=Prevotella sp. E13-17 TaxID=2913616 RepID=UPI001EDC11F5|nr:Ig-like domain-containing protein [Prevotella sp. E13-17]UKK51134.1 Ig-like domain-containing protein [Prevotella sp. E13-17]